MGDATRYVLLVGPPGSGKLPMARDLARELPAATGDDAVALAWMYTRMRDAWEAPYVGDPAPFRAPHYTVSDAGLVGGGLHAYPGEASLAHAGCLVLDELLEFRRSALGSLGYALGQGVVKVVRPARKAERKTRYSAAVPARERLDLDYPGRPALVVATASMWTARLDEYCQLVSRGAPWESVSTGSMVEGLRHG